ncbi:hypothetical protein [Absidia glauca]|uniref:MIF4G domain-containing protein n=1 Tax=Absidia glauca TaxID=4829 RepID=A0A168MRL2_ABSGL|nr:hypothetical protein [Absidia glauca]
MNSTPNSKINSDTNAKSTPQPVFNYAQAAKRNSQTLEQKTNPTTTGSDKPSNSTGSPGNKPSPSNPPQQQPSQTSTGNLTSTALQKDNDNTDMSGSKPATPSKPSFASIAHHTSSKQDQQNPRNSSVQPPRSPHVRGMLTTLFPLTTESAPPQPGSTEPTTTKEKETTMEKASNEQSPSTPHYQHSHTNSNNNRQYRHYNQNKHMNASFSPDMSNAQSGYNSSHGKKHTSPSAQTIPLAQNSWTNPIPGQYAIPIINPATMSPVKADPASSPSPAANKNSDKKDFKVQQSPSPKRGITIVDPAVKELEEREKQEKEEADRLAKEEEAARLVKEEEAARLAKEEEAARLAKEEEAARLAKEETDRLAKEEEAARLAKEETDRLAKEEEAARLAKEEEAARLAKEEETARLAKEEAAARLAKEEETARLAKEEAAARLAKEESNRRQRAEAERKMVEEETSRVKQQLAESTKAAAEINDKEERRIAAISAEKAAKPAPGRLDLSGIPAHVLDGEPQTQSPVSSPKKEVVDTRRKIVDFDAIQYPEGVTKTPTNGANIRYDAEFLLQFKPLCLESNEDLSAFQNIGDDSNERGGSGRGGYARRQSSRGGGPRTPDMHRNNSREGGRQDSMGKFAGGRPLSHRAGSGGPSSPGMQRDGSRGRSGRGKGRPPREQQGGPTIPLDQVVPLEKSENRWMPAVVATGGSEVSTEPAQQQDELIPQDVIIRKVKSLLNKLTLEKFDSISDQIWEYAHQSAKETDGESLLTVIQLIFDKACDEAPFASMWAQLCRKLHDTMAAADDIRDESNLVDKNGKPVTSGHLFRKYLFNRCQQAFERGWKFEIPDLEKSVSGEVMMTDEYYAAVKAKRQGLGLVQFIGELFKRGMLTDRIMTECLTRLCRNPQGAEDEETETMCKLVVTVGRELDHRSRNMHQWMDVFFDRMKEMLDCTTLTSRVKFMIQDMIELRKGNWVPRSGGPSGPSTIAQIREQAQKAKTDEKEAAMKRTPSSRGNTTPQSMSRQGSRAGGQRNTPQREASTNSNAGSTTGSDGWSTVGTATPVSGSTPKNRTNDFDGFGRTDRSKSRTNVLGPGSSPFQTLNRQGGGGGPNKKPDSKKGSPADSRSASPASSMSNMFSALGGDEERPAERKKLNLLPPRSQPAEPTQPVLTEQQKEQKAKDIIEEYILLRDAKNKRTISSFVIQEP